MTSNRAVPFSHSFQSHMIHDRRRESHCIAIVDTRITSFRTCGQELMEAFDAPHLLANHCSSVACFVYPVANHSYYRFCVYEFCLTARAPASEGLFWVHDPPCANAAD